MGKASPQVVDYLTRQLARNPIHESSDIVAARARAFKLNAKASRAANTPPAGQRQQVRDQLEAIRKQCFSAHLPQLIGQLDQLKLDEYPDLAALGKRLRVILDSRAKLPALSQNPRFDGDFFSCLKQVLVSPSRDVSVLREQVLSSFRHRRNRKRGQAMIRMIKEEVPELYALEAAWFDSLIHYKANKHFGATAQRSQSSQNQESSGGIPWWVVALVVFALLRGGRALHEASKKSEPERTRYSQPVRRPNTSPARPNVPPSRPSNPPSRPSDLDVVGPMRGSSSDARRRIEEFRQRQRERMDELRTRPTRPVNPENPFDVPAIPARP